MRKSDLTKHQRKLLLKMATNNNKLFHHEATQGERLTAKALFRFGLAIFEYDGRRFFWKLTEEGIDALELL